MRDLRESDDQTARPGVSLHVQNCVATILLDRPRMRNALGLAEWRALRRLVVEADADHAVRVIVLRGAAGQFCAGNDIAEFGALRDDPIGAQAFGVAMADAMLAIETAAKPVVVAIEGACYGAAVALTLAGDVRVASERATFAITPAKLGAVYLRSDLHRLIATIGVGQTKRLIYSAQAIGADEALRIGLVETVMRADDFDVELEAFVRALLAGSPFTLRQTKAMLRGLGAGPTPGETPESLTSFVEAIRGADFAEGVAAFLSKRAPAFR